MAGASSPYRQPMLKFAYRKTRPSPRAILYNSVCPRPRLRRPARDPYLGAQKMRAARRSCGRRGPWRGRVSQRPTISCIYSYIALTRKRKSQLAIQYAHSVRDATPHTYVFWVHASTQARFEQAYRGLADKLDLPGRLDLKADVLQLVSNWLCNKPNGQWIMVVDNVNNIETFFLLRRPD